MARGFADVAAISLGQNELLQDTERTVEQLTHALSARIVTEQAKGMLAERVVISPRQEFEHLRRHARNHNRKVIDVSFDVIEGRLARL